MNILIFDSNAEKANILKDLIYNTTFNIKTIHICNFYYEVSESILNKTFDLVLVNVEEHKLGFEVVARIKEQGVGLTIVVYGIEESYITYQKCLQYEVFEFVLLPVTSDSINMLMQRVINHREQKRKQFMQSKKELMEQSMELVEVSFIYSVLFHVDIQWDWSRYQYLLDITGNGYVITVLLERGISEQNLDYNSYIHDIKNCTTSGYKCIVSREITGKIVIFVLEKFGRRKKHSLTRTEQILLGEHIRSLFLKNYGCKVKIGIGSEKPVEQIPVSYEESLRELRFDSMVKENQSKIQAVVTVEKKKKMAEIEHKFYTGVREGSQEVINRLLCILDFIKEESLPYQKSRLIELLVVATHVAKLDGKNVCKETEFLEISKQLYMQRTWKELKEWTVRYITNLLCTVRKIQEETSTADIRKVVHYVELHYTEDIPLEKVAGLLNVSPQYFSRIFHDKTGSTYVDFLTSLRIEKAKEWLSYSENNVQEICYKVGYKDPNYFARVFKKMVGMTPRQYKSSRLLQD